MFEMIELDENGEVVDLVYVSDEPIGVFLDKARRSAQSSGKHLIVVSRYTKTDDDGIEYTDDDLSDVIWDSKGF